MRRPSDGRLRRPRSGVRGVLGAVVLGAVLATAPGLAAGPPEGLTTKFTPDEPGSFLAELGPKPEIRFTRTLPVPAATSFVYVQGGRVLLEGQQDQKQPLCQIQVVPTKEPLQLGPSIKPEPLDRKIFPVGGKGQLMGLYVMKIGGPVRSIGCTGAGNQKPGTLAEARKAAAGYLSFAPTPKGKQSSGKKPPAKKTG